MTEEMKPLIYAASEGPLSTAQAKLAFDILFEGKATPSQVGGFLMAMRAEVNPFQNIPLPLKQ